MNKTILIVLGLACAVITACLPVGMAAGCSSAQKIISFQYTSDIIKSLQDKDPPVRQSALQILGIINAKEAIPDIKKLLNDEDFSVSATAENDLKLLGLTEEDIKKAQEDCQTPLIYNENLDVYTQISGHLDEREFTNEATSDPSTKYYHIGESRILKKPSMELSLTDAPITPFFISNKIIRYEKYANMDMKLKEPITISKLALDNLNRVLLPEDRLKGDYANATINFDFNENRARYVLHLQLQQQLRHKRAKNVYYIVKLRKDGDNWIITSKIERVSEQEGKPFPPERQFPLFGPPDYTPEIKKVLNDKSEYVRKAAEEALKKLGVPEAEIEQAKQESK